MQNWDIEKSVGVVSNSNFETAAKNKGSLNAWVILFAITKEPLRDWRGVKMEIGCDRIINKK